VNNQPRQIELAQEAPFRLGVLEVRPATREVLAGTAREVLEPRVMQVLVALAERRGEVVSREELIGRCWSGRAVGDDAVNRCTGAVRKLALAYGGFALETIARVGYRLSETPSPEQAVAPRAGIFVKAPRWLLPTVTVFLFALAVAAFVLWRQSGAAVSPASSFSIAVLSFAPLSGPDAPLGDAVAVSVADMLSREGLDVVPPGKASQAFHADVQIEGEIRREPGRLLVSLRLVEAGRGTTLLADSVEAEADEEAALPGIVAHKVANWGWAIVAGYRPPGRWDPYLLAEGLKAANLLLNRNDAAGAFAISRQLAASAPRNAFAQTLNGLISIRLLLELPSQDSREAAVKQAYQSAVAAQRLDPRYGDPYVVLSGLTPTVHWSRREALLQQGLAIRPDSQSVTTALIDFYLETGRFHEAAALAESNYSRHPYTLDPLMRAIYIRLWLGDAQAAKPLIREGERDFPGNVWFPARLFEATAFGAAPEKTAALLQDPAAAPLLQAQGEQESYRHIAAALGGSAADAEAAAADCLQVRGRPLEFKRLCFVALVRLDRSGDAFRLMDRLFQDMRGSNEDEILHRFLSTLPFRTAYLMIPAAAPLRRDPRFRAVVERLGLLQYWKESGQPPDFCASEKAPVCALLK
jgi:DNA-binding winged helix-turn-helix (wHTH) protein/TolB-like protein